MTSPTEAQRRALDQLREVEGASGGVFEVLSETPIGDRLDIEIAVDCRPYERVAGGLPLRDRERFVISLQPDVPYEGPPGVFVPHGRWCGRPHVNWCVHLCLYLSPSTEWDPAAGMAGLVERLDRWLQDAALDRLDPADAPLHPPTAYPSSDLRVIPLVDAPALPAEFWTGLAVLNLAGGDFGNQRAEIVGWTDPDGAPEGALVAPAVLLGAPMPAEYPDTLGRLLMAVPQSAIPPFGQALFAAARAVRLGSPFLVVVGAPMRRGRDGEPLTHLAVWHMDRDGHRRLKRSAWNPDDPHLRRHVEDWMRGATLRWCPVHEMRPEVITRRDETTPTDAFRGKRVAIWGCGALGAPTAMLLARAGVGELVLRDSKEVTPGILVRQPYDPAYIGVNKAVALQDLLSYTTPDLRVEAHEGDVVTGPLALPDVSEGFDLIIDATANRTVLAKIEDARRDGRLTIPVASVSVDASASRGLLLYARAGHSGGPYDLSRRLKLAVTRDPALGHFAEAFFPADPVGQLRQPEPGCSDPTFVGSAADASALAASLLNALGVELDAEGRTAVATAVTQPHAPAPPDERRSLRLCPPNDLVLTEELEGYEVRVSVTAWNDILAWIRQSGRVRDPRDETGGLLFGQVDEALRVVWVSDASGPPPDSTHSPELFVCGTDGTAQMNEAKLKRTRGSVQFVGMWHSHPVSNPVPSPTDRRGTDTLFRHTTPPPRRSLLLIVGHAASDPTPAAYLYRRPADVAVGLASNADDDTPGAPLASPSAGTDLANADIPDRPVAHLDRGTVVVLQGRDVRALPFHAGVLRAIVDHDLTGDVMLAGMGVGGLSVSFVRALGVEAAIDLIGRVAAEGPPSDHTGLRTMIRDLLDETGSPPGSAPPCMVLRPPSPPLPLEGPAEAVAEVVASGYAASPGPIDLETQARTILWFGDTPPAAPDEVVRARPRGSGPDWDHPTVVGVSLYHDPPYADEAPADFVSASAVVQEPAAAPALDAATVQCLLHRGEGLARLVLSRVSPQ